MQKTIVYALLGVVLIVLGAYLAGAFGNTGVSAQDQARCEQIVHKIYGANNADANQHLLPKCNEPGMVSMMDAKDQGAGARTAAANIAQANQTSLLSVILGCALAGAGIGALGAAFTAFVAHKKRAQQRTQ